MKDYLICASRGRNPENPNDRTPEIHCEQRLEINWGGISNALTTVGKDNWVLEFDSEELSIEKTE